MQNQVQQRPGVGVGVMILRDYNPPTKEGSSRFAGSSRLPTLLAFGRAPERVLLGKRHEDPKKASSLLHGEGTWTVPGGKLHFQEGLREAATREVLEETGIKVKNLEIISISNDIVFDNHFVTIGFLCREFEGQPKVMETDEITKWQWFDLNNLPSPLFSPSERIIKNYLAKKIYQDE